VFAYYMYVWVRVLLQLWRTVEPVRREMSEKLLNFDGEYYTKDISVSRLDAQTGNSFSMDLVCVSHTPDMLGVRNDNFGPTTAVV